MKFSTKTILALSIISTSGVNGHGQLTQPNAPQIDSGYTNHWYTQGELNCMICNLVYLSRIAQLIFLLFLLIFPLKI